MMLIPGYRDQRVDLGRFTRLKVLLAEETRVGNHVRYRSQRLGLCRERLQHRLDLLLVVRCLRHPGTDHQHGRGIHRRLGVVGLFEPTARHRHDARLFVGEIDLVGGLRPGFRSLGQLAARLLASLGFLGSATGHLLVVLGLLSLIAFRGPCGNLGLGNRHDRQPVFPAFDLVGQTDPVRDVGLIGGFGQGKEFLHFGVKLGFELLDVPVREGTVAGGVGVNLGAVQTDRAKLEQLHLLG